MNALIIGGTGVLSSEVARTFLEKGFAVHIVTDGRGIVPAPEGCASHLIADRGNAADLARVIRSTGVAEWDVVVDVICYSGTDAEALEQILRGRFTQMIVVSTATIYDRRNRGPIRPDGNVAPLSELGAYGRGKQDVESFWNDKARRDGVFVTLFRPVQIIGRGCYLGLCPMHNRDPFLVHRISSGATLVLADGGRQLIQSVFAVDAAKAIYLAAGNSRAHGKTYNCANPEMFHPTDLLEVLAGLLRSRLNVRSIPSDVIWRSNWGWVSTTVSKIVSVSEMQDDLGYCPQTPMDVSVASALSFLTKAGLNRTANPEQVHAHDQIVGVIDGAAKTQIAAINAAAGTRFRHNTDMRMNTGGAVYRYPE